MEAAPAPASALVASGRGNPQRVLSALQRWSLNTPSKGGWTRKGKMDPRLSEEEANLRKELRSIRLVPVKWKRFMAIEAHGSRKGLREPWSSCSMRSAESNPPRKRHGCSKQPSARSSRLRQPKGGRDPEHRLVSAPRRHPVPAAPRARTGGDATGSEESRPKPQGRWTAAPELFRGERPTHLAAPAVRRENETGKSLFTTASSLDRLRRLRAAAVVAGRVRPMRRQEEGGRPELPPKEEPPWRRKRESTREEAHPPPLWATRNISALNPWR